MRAISPRESTHGNIPFYRSFKLWFWVILAVFAGGIYGLHHITLMQGDDYIYSFVFDATERGNYTFPKRVESLQDIFDSQINHYCYVNGRIAVHAILQFFLTLPTKMVWDVVATLYFFANAWLITLLLVREKSKRRSAFLIVAGLYWILMPKPSCTFFWMAGCANYQLGTLLCLSFIYLWLNPVRGRMLWLIFPLGLMAGNSNEALSVGLLGGMFIFALMNREKMTFVHWMSLVCFAIGLLFNIFSPGTRGRLDSSGCGDGLMGVLIHIAVGCREVTRFWGVLLIPFLLFFMACLFGTRDKRSFVSMGLPMAALISFVAVIYSGEISERSLYGAFLWSFVPAVSVLIQKGEKFPHAVRTVFYVVCSLSCAGTMVYASAEIADKTRIGLGFIRRMEKSQDSLVEYQERQNGWYTRGLSLFINRSNLQNRAIAAYFGMKTSYTCAPSDVLAMIRDIPSSAYEDLREGEYCRMGDLILVNLGNRGMICCAKTAVCYSDLSFCPNMFYRMRYEAKHGEKYIPNMALVKHGQDDYGIIFFSNIPQEKGVDVIRIKLLYKNEKKVWEFPMAQQRGKMGAVSE